MACQETVPPPIAVLKQRGGNTEGGRIQQIISASQRCAVATAIQRARASDCCATPPSNKVVPLESTNLAGRLQTCAILTAQEAQAIANGGLRGVPESVRIKSIQQRTLEEYAPYNNPQRRFLEYQGPQVLPPCPALPTEITNANLPKPSTRCDTLALLATGVPPNSIARGQT